MGHLFHGRKHFTSPLAVHKHRRPELTNRFCFNHAFWFAEVITPLSFAQPLPPKPIPAAAPYQSKRHLRYRAAQFLNQEHGLKNWIAFFSKDQSRAIEPSPILNPLQRGGYCANLQAP